MSPIMSSIMSPIMSTIMSPTMSITMSPPYPSSIISLKDTDSRTQGLTDSRTHGLLTSVRNLSLRNLDTAAVAELAVLASRVTDRVELDGVCGDLGPVLAGLRCDLLALD